jgi:serine/threonine protein kinase
MNESDGTKIMEYMGQGEAIREVSRRLGTPAAPWLVGTLVEKRQFLAEGQPLLNTMTLERWEEISRLFYATLEVNEKKRADFLKDACFGDADLLNEVRSLLPMDEQGGGLLGQPAMEEAALQLKEEPGSLLGRRLGPYQVVSLLGVGGMGEVYKGCDTRLERVVALKVLSADVTADKERLKRFQLEACAISQLNHPHICALYDMGEHRGRPFLVMEYLAGETLAERLKQGPLPLKQVLDIGAEVADALAAAHKQGVVHRDLKPGNVMLTNTGAKLIDFGLAKLKKQEASDPSTAETNTETTPGLVMGTLEYMSPEQLEGRPVDARTDLWALGAMLYEMIAGRRPFEGQSRARVIAAILEHDPTTLFTLQPLAPPLLCRLVQRCLAKSPDARWDNAHELADQLRAIRGNKRGVPPIGETARRVGRWKWAAIGLSTVVALVLQSVAGL